MILLRNCVLLPLALVCLCAANGEAQARLTVVNNSERDMTLKVMKGLGVDDSLHETISIIPGGRQTVLFHETGVYVAKTMATLRGRDPIYQKGQPFRVYVGRHGYSVLTLTFTIIESAVPQLTGGQQISKEEFERDSRR